ncbi:hypothetical protein ACFQ9X_05485 [Catenulispora yoronensis]
MDPRPGGRSGPGDPEAAHLLATRLHEAADALDGLVKVLSEARADAGAAYRRARSALATAGLTDEDLHGVAGFEGAGYAAEIRGILMAAQRRHRLAPDDTGFAPPRPSAAAEPGANHRAAPLSNAYQQALDALVQGHDRATAAAEAYDAAMARCARALKRVSEVAVPAVGPSEAVGTAGRRFAAPGRSGTDRRAARIGFEAAEGASAAKAWQAAKSSPAAPDSVGVLLQTGARLAAHRGDPAYLKGFADASPDGITAFQGLAAVDADLLNRIRLAEAVGQPDCPRALKDLHAGLDQGFDSVVPARDVYLLGFDTAGGGHVAVSFGNPDTAATTTMYLPGPAATLDGARGDLARVQRHHAEADSGAVGSRASVYYLGPAATTRFPASGQRAGGPGFAAFVNALNAQHHGPTNVVISRLGRPA